MIATVSTSKIPKVPELLGERTVDEREGPNIIAFVCFS